MRRSQGLVTVKHHKPNYAFEERHEIARRADNFAIALRDGNGEKAVL